LNISRLAQTAVADELDRHAKQAELDAYLSELEVELGPIPAAERMQAKQWADRAFDQLPQQRSA
ncbi:MAG: type II toxin-antitoxin system CcdA family antitoxin, partial [Candidatus Dormibacteraceae bacterium]